MLYMYMYFAVNIDHRFSENDGNVSLDNNQKKQ